MSSSSRRSSLREKSLGLRGSELQNEIEVKRKRLEYLKRALDETKSKKRSVKEKRPLLRSTTPRNKHQEHEDLFQEIAQEQAELQSRLLKATEEEEEKKKALEDTLRKLQTSEEKRRAAFHGDDQDTPWNQAAAKERAAAAKLLAIQDQTENTELSEIEKQCELSQTQLEAIANQVAKLLEEEQRSRKQYLHFLKHDQQSKIQAQATLLALALSDAEMRMHTKQFDPLPSPHPTIKLSESVHLNDHFSSAFLRKLHQQHSLLNAS